MAEQNLTSVPQTFPESNRRHFQRSAEVRIIKKIKNFEDPGMSNINDFTRFKEDFAEFLLDKSILLPMTEMDNDWLNPNDSRPEPLYKHYAIVANGEPSLSQKISFDHSAPAQSNLDVVQITATENTEGRGTCTIVLNSREDKYIFKKNPLKLGQTIFESNDEVHINISDATEKESLRRVFTGLITSATVDTILGDTLQTQITIQCEDMLKVLAQSRTCLKPSANANEARGNDIAWVNPRFATKSTHVILTDILSRAYCDLFTAPGFYASLVIARFFKPQQNAPVGPSGPVSATQPVPVDSQTVTTSAKMENDLIIKTLPFPSTLTTEDSGVARDVADRSATSSDPTYPFIVTLNNRIKPIATSANGILANALQDPNESIPSKIYGLRRILRSDNSQLTAESVALRSYVGLTDKTNLDDIAFVIDGTKQPAYAFSQAGSINTQFSDWKSGLAVCNQIAQDLNYEFYADYRGIVRFRPLNVSLPKDFLGEKPRPTNELVGSNGRVGIEYWLDPVFISSQSYTDTDNGVFTIARVLGDLPAGQANQAQQWHGTAVDLMKFNKLGPRMAPIVTKFNLVSEQACQAYAWGLLTRLNGNARTAQITYAGDSRLHAGNPCYVKHKNTVYYITSVTHNFVAGQSYTTTLTLKYGRRPVAVLDSPPQITDPIIQRTVKLKSFDNFKSDLKAQDGPLDHIVGRTLAQTFSATDPKGKSTMLSIVDYIDHYKDELTFQGYLWEILSPLSYEDLYNILGDQQIDGGKVETGQNIKQKTASFKQKMAKKQIQKKQAALKAKADATSALNTNVLVDVINEYLADFGATVKSFLTNSPPPLSKL